MRSQHLTIIWREGLHLRTAALLVRMVRSFQSRIRIRSAERMVDARNVLQLLLLNAGLGANLTVEADGQDEAAALRAVVSFFSNSELEHSPADNPSLGQSPTNDSHPVLHRP